MRANLLLLLVGHGTVYGRIPAPVDSAKVPMFFRISYITGGAGFLPSTVVMVICLEVGSYKGIPVSRDGNSPSKITGAMKKTPTQAMHF